MENSSTAWLPMADDNYLSQPKFNVDSVNDLSTPFPNAEVAGSGLTMERFNAHYDRHLAPNATSSLGTNQGEAFTWELDADVPPAVMQEELPRPPQHRSIQVDNKTSASDLAAYLTCTTNWNGSTSIQCIYPGCRHKFDSRKQGISHIRRIHLKEKPFLCMTCGTRFAHKQDASRHDNTKNSGKIYQCSICYGCYAREDYRDKHLKRCSLKWS